MSEELIHIDQQVLLAINGLYSDWADKVMWIISGKMTWIPLYALLIALIFIRCRRICTPNRWWLVALLVLVSVAGSVGIADFISSGIIKNLVCRFRPTHEPALSGLVRIVNGYKGSPYGFVSSHAADTMACALSFSLFWVYTSAHKTRANLTITLPLMVWVALNCYSRMYLGVHYPGDIIGGLLVGALVALPVFLLVRKVLPCNKEHLSDADGSGPLAASGYEDPRSSACS